MIPWEVSSAYTSGGYGRYQCICKIRVPLKSTRALCQAPKEPLFCTPVARVWNVECACTSPLTYFKIALHQGKMQHPVFSSIR